MQILLDECAPKALKKYFPGHQVRTVREMGWSGKRNGELLKLMMGAGFEVLLTVDKSIKHQQNVAASGVAVIVMVAATNAIPDLAPLTPSVNVALGTIKTGDVVEIAA